MPVPPGKAAGAMVICPQRDVPCSKTACLQFAYAAFNDETLSSPSVAARTLTHPTPVLHGKYGFAAHTACSVLLLGYTM